MKILKIVFLVILCISAIVIFFCAARREKTIKLLFLNSLFGILSLAAVDLTAKFTGVFIPVNIYSVLGAVFFGVPSTIGFLFLPFIFI